jgi:hypothetical protein
MSPLLLGGSLLLGDGGPSFVVTGEGALAAQAAIIVGAGDVIGAITGTGVLAAQAAAIVGSGSSDVLAAPIIDLLPQSDRGADDEDNITNATEPQFSIDLDANTQAGDILHVYDNAVEIGTGTALTAGQLAGTDPIFLGGSPLADGSHPITMTVENGNGESDPSNTETVVVDTSFGAASLALAAGGLTTDDTTPTMRVTCAGGLEGDIAYVNRASDGFSLGTGVWDATDETNGYRDVTLSELTEDDHVLDGGVYGDGTGNAAGSFSENAQETLTVSAAFHPSSLADIALVLDAMDAASLFQSNAGTTAVGDGDPVGFWGDGSGAGFDLTSLADDATRPLFSTTGYNHLVGNGTSSLLQRTASLGLYEAGEFSIFIALKSNSNSTFSDLFSMANSGTANPRFFLVSAAGTATSDTATIRDDALTGGTAPTTANAYNGSDVVLGKVEDGSNWTIYVDGVPAGPTAWTRPGTMTLNRTALFGRRGGVSSSWWAGDVAGVVAVKRAVTSGEAAQITTWLGLRQGRAL